MADHRAGTNAVRPGTDSARATDRAGRRTARPDAVGSGRAGGARRRQSRRRQRQRAAQHDGRRMPAHECQCAGAAPGRKQSAPVAGPRAHGITGTGRCAVCGRSGYHAARGRAGRSAETACRPAGTAGGLSRAGGNARRPRSCGDERRHHPGDGSPAGSPQALPAAGKQPAGNPQGAGRHGAARRRARRASTQGRGHRGHEPRAAVGAHHRRRPRRGAAAGVPATRRQQRADRPRREATPGRLREAGAAGPAHRQLVRPDATGAGRRQQRA